MKQTVSITEYFVAVLIAGLIVACGAFLAFSNSKEEREAALVDQLARFRTQLLLAMPESKTPAFIADVTCRLASSLMSVDDLPESCIPGSQKNPVDPYGKPVVATATRGVPNAFGGRTLFFVVDDKDNFLAYATKVPADVCAKFASDYLRCVETLPKDVPIAVKEDQFREIDKNGSGDDPA